MAEKTQSKASRTENSLRNITSSIVAYAAKFTASFFFRMAFVRSMDNVYAGIDGLFSTVLYVISLVEMGYEVAMAYMLYRPIAEENQMEVRRIMAYYRKASRRIAALILVLGAALIPFLPQIVGELPDIPQIRWIFMAATLNMALEYLFKYRRTLICALQKQYICTLAHYLAGAAMDLLQIAAVLLTHNYLLCLLLQGCGLLLEAMVEGRYINRRFGREIWISENNNAERARISRQVRPYLHSVALHKAGAILLSHGDVLLVSQWAGILQAGIYSNYKYIIYALNSVYTLLMESVAAGIGELGAREDKQKSEKIFSAVQLAGAWIYGFSAVCLYILFNPFITLWLGESSLFCEKIVVAIVLRFYINGMKKAVVVYRDALGLFIYDRWIPLAEVLLFFVFSLLLCSLGMGVDGVMYGSVLAAICTSVWIEPLLLYRRGFAMPGVGRYFMMYMAYTVCTLAGCLLTKAVVQFLPWNGLAGFLGRMAACMFIPNLLFWLSFGRTEGFQLLQRKLFAYLRKSMKKKLIEK